MTKERIAELRDLLSNASSVGPELVLVCLDEIERMDNIATIQQKQIERLLEARDAEKMRADSTLNECNRMRALVAGIST